jgi:hypothetical protein
MDRIVRRTSQLPQHGDTAADSLAERTHRGKGLSVTSQLSLGISPKIHIAWNVDRDCWQAGFSLMVFHSTSGFSPEKYPDDLNRHGRLIVETTHDDGYEEQPSEGTHFYTFLLHKRGFLGLWETHSLVRFSETVPTAKIAIGRIKDKMELEDLLRRHELDQIEFEAKLDEAKIRRHQSSRKLAELDKPTKAPANAAEAMIADELAHIDAMLLAFAAKRRKVEELKKDPRFTQRLKPEQDDLLNEIDGRLDAAELSARREMHKS